MKTALLFIILSLVVVSARAQSQSTPFKTANVITVQTADSAAAALRKIGFALVQQGYMVEKFDKQFLLLTARPRHLSQYNAPIVLTIRVCASPTPATQLSISGEYAMVTFLEVKNGPVQCPARGLRGANYITFTELDKLAKSYPAGVVAYEKR